MNEPTAERVKRNFENYRNRHEAFLAFDSLKSPCRPYWFADDGIKAYIAVEFDEWLWLPVQDSPAYPVEWKKVYIQGFDEEEV